MKRILLATLGIALIACTPKASKSVAKTDTGSEKKTESAVNLGVAPDEAMLTAAKTKFSSVTMNELKKGQYIYYEGQCVGCHGAQAIGRWDEKQWVGILDNMAVKAKLEAADKDAVWKYIMGVKLAVK